MQQPVNYLTYSMKPSANKMRCFSVFLFSCNLAVFAADNTGIQTLEEMVVMGAEIKQSATQQAHPAVVLSGESLRSKIGQTLGETLQNELGATNQSFGAGVGTPVIRGQSGPRVKVMQNSLGNNDLSTLSPDHANGVDPIIAERIELLRGPSTLLYGNGAIGGIVNVIDNRIPETLPAKLFTGAGEQRYDSASNESASAFKLEGGKNHIAYHLDGFYRDQNNTHISGAAIDESAVRLHDPSFNALPAGALQNSNGVIDNTQARTRGGSIGLSSIGDKGLVGIAVNSLEKKYGIPPDGHGEAPISVDMNQSKYDFKAELNKPLKWTEAMRLKFGYTDYQHVEYEGDLAGTRFNNEAFESRFELEHQPLAGIEGVLGFQSTHSQFVGLGGDEQIVPQSQSHSFALFAVESFSFGKVSYQLGARAEGLLINAQGHSDSAYKPLSGSASALWQIDQRQHLSLAFTHSQRAPQIQELFVNGFHHATRSFEQGNTGLSKELSNNLDLTYRFNTEWLTVDISLFHNWVNDYIYQQRSASLLFNAQDGGFVSSEELCEECFPVLTTAQTDAIFKGFEAQTVLTMLENRYGTVDLTLFGDYTRGTFADGRDAPRMPPLRYGFQISFEDDDFSTNLRLTRAEAQNLAGENETTTPAYLLLNLGAQYRLSGFNDSEVLLFAKGKNLLNETIRNSTSYLRNFSPEPGRSAELGIRINF
jgi:iron complex outermembrane receptor protein